MSLAAASMPDTVDRPFESVFPLPLTPIEAFMAIDARPGYSWAVDMELRFRGCVDRGAFERALAVAVERNPLFTCRIDGGARGPYAWVPTDAKPSIAWLAESEDLGERYDAYVDLTAEPGLCVFVRQGEDRSRVLLHYHHACCDGIGGFSFVEDLLAAYAAAVGGEAIVAPRGLVPSRLVTRAQASVPYRTPWQQVGDSFVGLWEGLKLLFGRPQTIAAPTTREPDARAMGQQPAFISVTCSAEVKAGLRRVADEAGATTNDVLLRDLFLVLKRWNELHGGTGRRGPLRILMPQNLREPADAAAPAANIMSFAFLTRRARACERPEALLASIRDETAHQARQVVALLPADDRRRDAGRGLAARREAKNVLLDGRAVELQLSHPPLRDQVSPRGRARRGGQPDAGVDRGGAAAAAADPCRLRRDQHGRFVIDHL